jgi:hypothetical protein
VLALRATKARNRLEISFGLATSLGRTPEIHAEPKHPHPALLSSLRRGRDYPFLRITRWLVRALATGYGVLGLILAVILAAESTSSGLRAAVVLWGGPAEGQGALAATLLLATVAVRTVLLLAVSEGLQLLLDVREAQLDAAVEQGELRDQVMAGPEGMASPKG